MKKMGKVVAVLAGLSMMLTGVGTAYADDAAGDAAVSQSQTATADAQAAQSQSDAAKAQAQSQSDAAKAQDAAKADQNAKQSAKTPAPVNVDPQVKQAAPKAEAKAAADGAQISKVVAPSTPLMYGADYDHVDESAAFKVTLTGLTPGKAYGVMSSMNRYNGDLPAIGQTISVYDYDDPVFTASAATQTIDVFYSGLRGGKKPSSTVQFALVAGDKVNVDNGGNKSLDGTVVNTYGGVNVKVIDIGTTPVTLDSQSVEDVGVHTAGLKAHYTVDSSLINEVSKICYSTSLVRIYTVSGKFTEDWPVGWGPRMTWDCVTNAISDKDDTTGAAYKVSNIVAPYTSTQTVMGQWFSRGHTETAEEQPNKTLPASGEIKSVIPGLLANTKYGNWGYTGTPADMELVYYTAESETTAKDPVSMIYSGIVLTFKDGSQFIPNMYENEAAMKDLQQDFTTKPAANGPVSSDDLTGANKNGVEGADNGKATAGSTYRVYVDSLKDTTACKTAIESGQYCYWAGYIYSEPKQLDSADGKSSAVRVDKDGKAYVEFNIPADTVNGDHKIALYDNDGNLLGWTPVTVAEGQEPTPQPEKPSAEDVYALQSAIKEAESKKQADYTAESWAPFAAALKAAQDVAAKSDATKAEVTAATAKLAEASKNLVKAGSTTPNKPDKPTKPNKDNNKNQQKLPITGSSVLVIAFVAIALVAAGVSVVVYRRRNA